MLSPQRGTKSQGQKFPTPRPATSKGSVEWRGNLFVVTQNPHLIRQAVLGPFLPQTPSSWAHSSARSSLERPRLEFAEKSPLLAPAPLREAGTGHRAPTEEAV